MDMIAYVIENYKGKPKIITDKYDGSIISSYKYQFVGHNDFGFDNYIVLNCLPKTYTNIKMINTSRGLIKLIFKAGSASEGDRELPKYVKFVCSKCHISGSLKSIRKEYSTPPRIMTGEIEHDLVTLSS